MSIHVHAIHSNSSPETDLSRCVTATIEPRFLPQLREALRPIQGLVVIITSARAWGGGPELRYRGGRVTVDREMRRVEIACRERDVESVMRAVQEVVDRSTSQSAWTSDRREQSTSSARPVRAELAI